MTRTVTQPGVENSEMYLRQRAGVWYFRRRVPSDLEGIIEPARFHYSLKTRNRQEAITAYSAALTQSEREIGEAREKIRTASEQGHGDVYPGWREQRRIKAEKAKRKRSRVFYQYSERDISLLVSRWFEKEKRETDAIYRDAHTMAESQDERDTILEGICEQYANLTGNPPEINPPEMADMILSRKVRSILDEEDCDPPHEWLNDPLFRRFYGLVAEGLLLLNRIAFSLAKTGVVPEGFQGIPAFAAAALNNAPAPASHLGRSVTLDELISRFQNEPKRQRLREASREEYHFTYRLLREHFGGDKPIASITRDDIKAVTDTIRHLPARATLVDKTTPLRELAERAKTEGKTINIKTYNKKVGQLTALFGYAVTEQLCDKNSAQGLKESEPRSNGEDKVYDLEQLKAIFTGSVYQDFTKGGQALQFVPNHRLHPCLFWAPLIALFHGMRSNEILQLKIKNIIQQDGVWAMKIEGELKNFQSYRTLPIHPEVLKIGLLEYAEHVKKAGHEDLFPDAKTAIDGKRSTWFQKPFARYITKIGVKTDRRQCFHSFRHTWNTGMKRADVPKEIRKTLGGWSDDSAESDYGAQDMARLLKHLEKLSYPGLDLSHLLPKNREK